MRNTVQILIFFTLITFCSCSEGEPIQKTFSFDEDLFDFCEITTNNFAYFKINNQTSEGTSFNFNKTDFKKTEADTYDIILNGTNQLIYRKLNKDIDRDYYCGILPPRDITVQEEYISSGGTATVATKLIKKTTISDDATATVTERVFEVVISFENLVLDSSDERIIYETLVLKGNSTQEDTVLK